MTIKDKDLPWNRDAEVPNGKPKSKGGFTINTGVNEIHNERPVSPYEMEEKEDIKVTDRDIGVLFPSLLFKSSEIILSWKLPFANLFLEITFPRSPT